MVTLILLTVAMAKKRQVERRRSGGLRGKRPGGLRANLPAAFGGARLGGSRIAHQEERCSGGFRGQSEPTACRQIEQSGLAPKLDENGAERAASRSFQPGLEDGARIIGPDHGDPGGIEPEFGEALGIGKPRFRIRQDMADPEQRATLCGQKGAAEPEPQGAWGIGVPGRVKLVTGSRDQQVEGRARLQGPACPL